MTHCDYLIIGGGTAGSIMASRLSENSANRVLLLEAGEDVAPGREPADIQDAFPTATLNPAYFWPGLNAIARDGDPARPYLQARVIGGGSSINGMFSLRGVPSDYVGWAAAGGAAFSWDAVLPYFRRVEDDLDAAASQGGCHAVSRTPFEAWPPFAQAMARAAQDSGVPLVADINEHQADGFFAMPNAIRKDTRVTSAGAYLTPTVRARANLEIRTRTQAIRLHLRDGVISGADVQEGAELRHLSASRVILCAGGVYSPTLLLRSGIGPAGDLAALGIACVLDRPGVGRNLQNHPYMFFALTLPHGKRAAASLRRFAVAGMRTSSQLPGAPSGDLFSFVLGRVSGEAFGPGVALVGSALYAPESRGTVTLSCANTLTPPSIRFNFLSNPADPPRMIQAARATERLLRDPQVAAEYGEAFLMPGALSVKQFNRPGLAGKALALAATAATLAPAPLRRPLFEHAFKSGAAIVSARAGRSVSDQEILSSICPMGHPVGTCALGPPTDSMAVVDNNFRVYGTRNLYVADASVMPRIPSANTNLPTMMLAEMAAEKIGASHA